MPDPFALKVAAFVATALELDADPEVMADAVVALKRDANAGISTIELQSEAGSAPFLVYHYLLEETGDDGTTGQERFDQDLATLTRATEQNTPGPRILAHATADREAYVLATTPEVFKTLTGSSEPPAAETESPPVRVSGKTALALRKRSADNLMKFLRQANAEAGSWLRAVQAAGDEIELTPEESALALFLVEQESIKNMLLAINLLIETAQDQAAKTMKPNGV